MVESWDETGAAGMVESSDKTKVFEKVYFEVGGTVACWDEQKADEMVLLKVSWKELQMARSLDA